MIKIGQIFGKLTVIDQLRSQNGHSQWRMICSCGTECTVSAKNLGRSTNSCGCLRKTANKFTSHKQSKTSIYRIWGGMLQRCTNPNHTQYKDYGGRGIRVDSRWGSFENFHADMGDRPEGLSLDRIDNNDDYGPYNCRWATRQEQHNNRRNTLHICHNGKTQTFSQWATELNIPLGTLHNRYYSGMNPFTGERI